MSMSKLSQSVAVPLSLLLREGGSVLRSSSSLSKAGAGCGIFMRNQVKTSLVLGTRGLKLGNHRNLSFLTSLDRDKQEHPNNYGRYLFTSSLALALGLIYSTYKSWIFVVEAAKPIVDPQNDSNNSGRGGGTYSSNGGGGGGPTDNSGSTRGSKRRQNFNFVADVVETVGNSVVCIELKDTKNVDWVTGKPQVLSNGSGFIVSDDGLILTNAHVVAGNKGMCVTVKLYDGRCFAAKIEDIDINSDLAVIRINARGLPVMPLGTSSTTRIGEWVVALGSPLSLSNTVTAGVVSSMDRKALELGISTNNISYIQTDAAITFGNSGGPLVNMDGEAIGINSMKVTAGISFAIPIDYVKVYLSEAEKRRVAGGGQKKRRYIGATLLTLSDDLVAELHANNSLPYQVTRGILAWKIVVGSPSYKAGLKPGDIIYGINKVAISSTQEIFEALRTSECLNLHIKRGGQDLILQLYPEDIE